MIILSAGHNPGAPGACFNGFCEHFEAVKWVDLIGDFVSLETNVDVTPVSPLYYKVKWINDYNKWDVKLACEIHFNSDPRHGGRGSETLYCPGSSGGLYAGDIVQSALGMLLPPNRGAKEGWYRMDRPGHKDYPGDVEGDEKPDYFLKATKPVALIIEPEFIHRQEIILKNRREACKLIAKHLVIAANGLK